MNRRDLLKSILAAPLAALLGKKARVLEMANGSKIDFGSGASTGLTGTETFMYEGIGFQPGRIEIHGIRTDGALLESVRLHNVALRRRLDFEYRKLGMVAERSGKLERL